VQIVIEIYNLMKNDFNFYLILSCDKIKKMKELQPRIDKKKVLKCIIQDYQQIEISNTIRM
jgi:hypothetical protein